MSYSHSYFGEMPPDDDGDEWIDTVIQVLVCTALVYIIGFGLYKIAQGIFGF